MPKTPSMNLAPEATPWGRWVQDELETLKRSAARREQGEDNANQSQGGTLTSLAKQIRTLNELAETQGQMIADLQEIVNAQVVPWVSSGAASGFLATTTFTTFVNAPIAVPVGYTRALVLASGQVSAGNSSAMDIAQIFAHIVINGVAGADSSVSVTGIPAATVPAFASASLTGLSGGWVTVALGARTSNNSSSPDLTGFDKATLTAQAIFLR